ncbi:hypothetical protein [Microbacterium sp. C7(2022)]|uniref:hypothetical protein n=1 Tax=Microbacterium sp. C7(2022) TaxID=2992759 RepID=UPI00237ABA0A|nr:hypothetical protein [Microbacterium sp. C7(2022)]MDE0547517.1 hypothetical protein [Microbacterium sp. C7(2022)]
MDLNSATADEIGSALDRMGLSWNFDKDGDVRVRFRRGDSPWTDVVFYEFDSARQDFSMRGYFLNARAVPQGNGKTNWEVADGLAHKATAVAQKVVTVYLMPRQGGLKVQIHASVAPLNQPRPMHIKVVPNSTQISRIERDYPGLVGRGDSEQSWIAGEFEGTLVSDSDLRSLLGTLVEAGRCMFEGPFTGWLFATEV